MDDATAIPQRTGSKKRSKKSLPVKIALILLTIALVLTLDVLLLSNALRGTLLNPDFYIDIMEKENFYEAIRIQAKDAFISQSGTTDARIALVFERSFSLDWISSEMNSVIRSFFSYINGETEELTLVISMKGLKENFKAALLDEISSFIPESLLSDQAQIDYFVDQMMLQLDSEVPDELDVLSSLADQARLPEFLEGMKQARGIVSLIHSFFYVLIFLALVFMGLILFLLKDSLKDVLRRIGASFFISGSSMFFLKPIVMGMVNKQFSSPDTLPVFMPANFLESILLGFLKPVSDGSTFLLILGVSLVVASFILFRGEKNKGSTGTEKDSPLNEEYLTKRREEMIEMRRRRQDLLMRKKKLLEEQRRRRLESARRGESLEETQPINEEEKYQQQDSEQEQQQQRQQESASLDEYISDNTDPPEEEINIIPKPETEDDSEETDEIRNEKKEEKTARDPSYL